MSRYSPSMPRLLIRIASLAVLGGAAFASAQPSNPANPPANSASAAPAQTPPATPAGSPADATTQPGVEQLKARVIEVRGSVEFAPVGTSASDFAAWKPVQLSMEFASDTQVRTALRSRCVLMFGQEPNQTVISLKPATLAAIGDFYRTPSEQRIRVGLGYGAIRGGSTEGTLRSDVVIDSTVATLAKRGTEGWEIEVEPTSGHFRISLARAGLVTALSHLRGEQRSVRVGQYATDDNIARMWVNQALFDRTVAFYEILSATESDMIFMANRRTGLGSVAPAGGNQLQAISGRGAGLPGAPLANPALSNMLANLQTLLIQGGIPQRPEGDFGFPPTFRVAAPRHELDRAGARPHSSSRLRLPARPGIERRSLTTRVGR